MVCACCGKQLTFVDALNYITINNEQVCSACCNKIGSYHAGNLTYEEVVSESSSEKIVDYLKKTDEELEIENKEKERIENKITAQKNDPLYDDIHQLAGDLRFIKNLIIAGLIVSFILGIIAFISML